MQILTSAGYIDVHNLYVGQKISAFDSNGIAIENEILDISFLDKTSHDYSDYHYEDPSDGSLCIREGRGFNWYLINNKYKIFMDQSIWRNDLNVCHGSDLVIGDILYAEDDSRFAIADIRLLSESDAPTEFCRFSISGDHSYIIDGIQVHNANRVWVLGNGTWGTTQTANWAASSGGTGGNSVPTTIDDVSFDTASSSGNYTVTTAGAIKGQNITIGPPAAGTLTFAGSGAITVYGSWNGTISATVAMNWTGLTTFASTLPTNTINNFNGNSVTFNGTGSWLVTNLFYCGGTTGILTITAGTVSWGTSAVLFYTNSTTPFVGTIPTFYNLFLLTNTSAAVTYNLSQNLTITGTLTLGNSVAAGTPLLPIIIQSNTLGTTRTITCTTLSNYLYITAVNFRDITFNVTNTSSTGIYLGDLGGNTLTGTSFTTPITAYLVSTGTTAVAYYQTTNKWFTTSGGTTPVSRPPALPQDTVILDANSGTGIFTQNLVILPNFNTTNFTGTLTTSTISNFYGDLIIGTGVTLTASTQAYTYYGRGSKTLTSGGKTWGKAFTLNSVGGTLNLGSNFTGTTLTLTNGTLNDGGYTHTTSLTVNGPVVFNKTGNWYGTWTFTSGTLNDTAGYIYPSGAFGSIFAGGGKVYNGIVVPNGYLTITGSNTFNNFTLSTNFSLNFTAGTTTTIGNWNVNGSPTADDLNGGYITNRVTIGSTGATYTLQPLVANTLWHSNWITISSAIIGNGGILGISYYNGIDTVISSSAGGCTNVLYDHNVDISSTNITSTLSSMTMGNISINSTSATTSTQSVLPGFVLSLSQTTSNNTTNNINSTSDIQLTQNTSYFSGRFLTAESSINISNLNTNTQTSNILSEFNTSVTALQQALTFGIATQNSAFALSSLNVTSTTDNITWGIFLQIGGTSSSFNVNSVTPTFNFDVSSFNINNTSNNIVNEVSAGLNALSNNTATNLGNSDFVNQIYSVNSYITSNDLSLSLGKTLLLSQVSFSSSTNSLLNNFESNLTSVISSAQVTSPIANSDLILTSVTVGNTLNILGIDYQRPIILSELNMSLFTNSVYSYTSTTLNNLNVNNNTNGIMNSQSKMLSSINNPIYTPFVSLLKLNPDNKYYISSRARNTNHIAKSRKTIVDK
jgi:hypothetical protein